MMSRSNPLKKKRRSAKRTLLFYGEGPHEVVFLRLLRGYYSCDSGTAVTIRPGKGGSADGVVQGAMRYSGCFQCRAVLLDNDKSRQEMEKARALAKEHHIELIENTPCLDALLLEILTEENWCGKPSASCKKEFEDSYIEKKKRSELVEYHKVFSKDLLGDARGRMPVLERIIHLMEGGT